MYTTKIAEPELELIQTHMAHKPMLRGEVGARALRMRSVPREEVWASTGVQGAWVSGCAPIFLLYTAKMAERAGSGL